MNSNLTSHEADCIRHKSYNEGYRAGYRDALANYAIWKDGVPIVGCSNTPLTVVLERDEQKPIPVRY